MLIRVATGVALLRSMLQAAYSFHLKQQEEIFLYLNMRGDAVQQVLRRLNHAKAP